jgi:hypothetical protein
MRKKYISAWRNMRIFKRGETRRGGFKKIECGKHLSSLKT